MSQAEERPATFMVEVSYQQKLGQNKPLSPAKRCRKHLPEDYNRRRACDKIFDTLELLNLVRYDEDFQCSISGIRRNNWGQILVKLVQALKNEKLVKLFQELNSEKPDSKRISDFAKAESELDRWDRERAEREEPRDALFSQREIHYDLPQHYRAKEDGTPTRKSTSALLLEVRWTLVKLLSENKWREGILKMQSFFEELQQERTVPVPFKISWFLASKLIPELQLGVGGIDTNLWWTLLEFLRENPNWKDIVGRCPQCGDLFAKRRKDQKFCYKPCKRLKPQDDERPQSSLSKG